MANSNNNTKFNPSLNTARIDITGNDNQSVFPARNLYNKTAQNMAEGEKLTKDINTENSEIQNDKKV